MSPSATPATQSGAAPRATNGDQARHKVQLAPRLTRETKRDVTKCHACHAKWRGAPGEQRRPSAPPSATCAAPATPNAGSLQVPRLPRETKVDVTKCQACHVKRRWMSPSATPAT